MYKVPNQSGKETHKPYNDLIYLVDEDMETAKNVIMALKSTNYNVQHFSDLQDFERACQNKVPDILIIDAVFQGNKTAGFDLITKLKKVAVSCPPIIFISSDTSIEVRLAAARSGGLLFLPKPVNLSRLVYTVNELAERNSEQPFRILLIDDDKISLKYYSTLFLHAGLNVQTLSNPLEALDVIANFNPDIVILDYHMPECTGPELVQMIRQEDQWAMMAIIYLSSEENINRQLEAIDLGGDAFFKKTVDVNYLVKIITAKAKRARWINRLNNNLLSAIQESRYYMTTVNQHNIISVTDVSGKITSVNDKFCEISGYSREELLGKNHRVLKSDYHPKAFYADIWNTITKGEIWHGVICNLTKSGKEYWVESTIVPFLNEQGKPYKYISARTDITELRQSEERLSRSQNFAHIGSWDWDIHTGDLIWSDNIWSLLGLKEKNTPATYDNFIKSVHPEDRQMVTHGVDRCIEHNDEYNIEHRIIWPDGTIHWLQESGNIVQSKKGKILHMLGIVQNIDEKKATEFALIKAREEAERANHIKTQFFANMSHELRTPLNGIMGFGQLLMVEDNPPLSQSQQENVNEIIKAGNHLLALINGVLDIAKIEAGEVDFSIEMVTLANLIHDTLGLITPLAQNRGIKITMTYNNIPIDFEKLSQHKDILRADPIRLKQILINLLSNAVKYNYENGRIIVAFNAVQQNLIRISIIDTGIGIDSHKQDQLFKPFHRMGAETSTIEGTGIGLSITKNLIEQMGGTIGVQSTPGKGSHFWIELYCEKMPPSQEKKISTTKTAQQKVTKNNNRDPDDAGV